MAPCEPLSHTPLVFPLSQSFGLRLKWCFPFWKGASCSTTHRTCPQGLSQVADLRVEQTCPVLSCPVLSRLVLSCLIPFRPVPSLPVLACPGLSRPVLSMFCVCTMAAVWLLCGCPVMPSWWLCCGYVAAWCVFLCCYAQISRMCKCHVLELHCPRSPPYDAEQRITMAVFYIKKALARNASHVVLNARQIRKRLIWWPPLCISHSYFKRKEGRKSTFDTFARFVLQLHTMHMIAFTCDADMRRCVHTYLPRGREGCPGAAEHALEKGGRGHREGSTAYG